MVGISTTSAHGRALKQLVLARNDARRAISTTSAHGRALKHVSAAIFSLCARYFNHIGSR